MRKYQKMSATKILYGACICTILTSVTMAQDNPLKFLAGVSQGIADLGRNFQCLADKGDTAEIIAKVYHVYDDIVTEIKKNVDGPVTAEKFPALLRIIVVDAAKSLKAIDVPCSGYCRQGDADFSHAPQEFEDTGTALETMGLTMSCLLDDPKPEILSQIPVIVGGAIQSVGVNTDTSKTSAAILLKEILQIVKGLQKLSTRCVNITRKC